MSVDSCVFMPVERWSEIKSVFLTDWPRSLCGYLVLDTQEYILQTGIDYGFKVYCPFGNVNNGIVAINIKDTFYEVIIQCPNDDTRELEEALRTTNLIDWWRCNEVPYTPYHVRDCVKRLSIERNLKLDTINATVTYMLDKEALPYDVRLLKVLMNSQMNLPLVRNAVSTKKNQQNMVMPLMISVILALSCILVSWCGTTFSRKRFKNLPPGYTFDLLTLDHIDMINDHWPHKYPGSKWYFELLTKAKLGYGLYNGEELIAWVFIKEMGALGHLYTLDKYRRKGYGELVLKLISNVFLKDKKYTVAFCSEGNVIAANLYIKLGFRMFHELYWCNRD